jgi:hypothetical protein
MLKVMAVLRALVLAILTPYALWGLPWTVFSMPKTFDEQYARCSSSLQHLTTAMGLAAAWLLLDVLVGWWLAFPRKKPQAVAEPAKAP